MPLWMLILLLMALIKLPIAALMLWLPFRNDEAMTTAERPGQSDDGGGSLSLPAGPLEPHPRSPLSSGPSPRHPRRGPHGAPAPPSPRRVRTVARATRGVRVSR
jgi:hypothetical protein